MSETQKLVSFGFQDIPETEKQSRIEALFSSVSGKYDLMNDVMSLGQHRLWKNYFIQKLAPRAGKKYLDVAGGTGDIALKIAQKINSGVGITILDLTHKMLLEGTQRTAPFNHEMSRICADAQNLPFKDCSFDYYTISFGIRNVTNIEQTLSEAYRVLKPGGKFMCLEFSHLTLPSLFKQAYDSYSFKILPKMGDIIAKDAASYQYLAESIRRFPNQKTFLNMIRHAGFEHASFTNLSAGITAIHSGYRIR